MTTDRLEGVLARLDDQFDATLARLVELLSIPSVSTDPAYASHVGEAAAWVAQALRDAGLDVTVHEPEGGHPIVVGKTQPGDAPDDGPRVLYYGHYDVQPPDPMELWTTGPFDPAVRDGAVHARGASDDKGQILTFIEALRAWREQTGGYPAHATVIIEGEEECGSASLGPFLQQHADEFSDCQVVLISDTTMWDADTPAIVCGLRGLLYYDIQLHGPSRDLHSGMYGGSVPNPATLLTRVLGRLFDADMRVTVPGFYDDVTPITDAERELWREVPFDEAGYLASIGLNQPFGEAGFSTLERKWARPACDVNGLYGGYQKPGAKTVIPAMAGAKVSFRLAPNQDPARIAEAFEAWVRSFDVGDCTWTLTCHGQAHPVLTPTDSPWVKATCRAVEATAGRTPLLVREGATIPVVSDFSRILGLDTVLLGFGLTDDRIHSPNEKFDLACFRTGQRAHAALLAEVARRTDGSHAG